MDEFEGWLEKMASEPLPGGVVAGALSAAMGAALVGKAAAGRHHLVDLARTYRARLLRLAADDEAAYYRVLDTRALPASDEARRRARQMAIEVPLRVAEACQSLLAELPASQEIPSPALAVDLEIGRRLVAAGLKAGVLAAEQNLGAWGKTLDAWSRGADVADARRRLAALEGGEST